MTLVKKAKQSKESEVKPGGQTEIWSYFTTSNQETDALLWCKESTLSDSFQYYQTNFIFLMLSLSPSFPVLTTTFPGGSGFASTRMSPFWILLRMMEVVVTTGAIGRAKLQSNHRHQQTNTQLLQAGCLSCHPTNSVKALKGNTQPHIYCMINI